MSKKTIGIIIALIIAAAVIAGIVVANQSDETPTVNTPSSNTQSSTESNTNQDEQPTDSQQATDTFTTAEVAQHSTASDCWTIINGKVYDLTSFISNHPGGDEILLACGTDGSTLFNSRQTENGEEIGSGTPHSSSAESQLAELQIGTLAQ